MITRDSVQGFIDGYKASGGDMSALRKAVGNWLSSHPQYPSSEEAIDKILSDLESYRQ